MMKLSILDQIPIAANATAQQALEQSLALAQLGDQLGYTRFWLAEHHNTQSLASSAPEISIATIAAQTEHIRVGSGGIMSMHYSALKIAEVFNTLSAYNPNRIDLGIGRAPGGDHPSIAALAQGRRVYADDQYDKIKAILHLMNGEPSELPEYRPVRVTPANVPLAEPWLLGSTGNSALRAGQLGLGYSFAQFFNGQASRAIFDHYRKNFVPNAFLNEPKVVVTYAATVAPTLDEAEYRARAIDLYRLQLMRGQMPQFYTNEEAMNVELTEMDKAMIEENRKIHFVGTPDKVAAKLQHDAEAFGFDEAMINANQSEFAHRIETYELLAKALLI